VNEVTIVVSKPLRFSAVPVGSKTRIPALLHNFVNEGRFLARLRMLNG